MRPATPVRFGDFAFDSANERLWRGSQAIALRPKAFAVLRHLLEHRDQLVTKQELLESVWPGTFVTDAVLKDCIRQLREALEDDAASPRYIETAHRRGYRFIARISSQAVEAAPAAPVRVPPPHPAKLLGRDAELAKLGDWLDLALRGERQAVFVTGEAGIGKSTVVTAFVEAASTVDGLLIARGQCLEQYGSGEAYLPVLDGLSRLGRGSNGRRIVEVLRQHAPAWLRELPSLIPASDREQFQPQVGSSSRERMLREMAEAVEALTSDAPLVVVLEDLHWSDYSTLDLVAYLARRRDPARLMVIGTYRPVEVILNDHPLKGIKRELQAHGLCREIPLEYLTEEAVGEYLARTCSGSELPPRLARLIHRRTGGNPLFMVNVAQYLVDEELIVDRGDGCELRAGWDAVESAVPDNLKQLIEKQMERLTPDDRRVLEGASVVGMECSSVAIAAGLAETTTWVEEHCEALVRRHRFLQPGRLVELPDGTITPRYKFSHVLYLDVPYSLIPPMQRSQIHGRVGARGEAIYGDRVTEIATEVAMHFEQARDLPRAVKYLLMGAEIATQRSAHHEAVALARRGLAALTSLPETPERAGQELRLRMIVGNSLMTIEGFLGTEVEASYRRALELSANDPPSPRCFMVEWFWGLFSYFRGELREAHQIGERLLTMALGLGDPVCIIEAHRAIGVCLVELGRFSDALEHLDAITPLYEEHRYRERTPFAGHDPKVVGDCFAARALWALGDADAALRRIQSALALARELSQPQTLAIASHFASHLHQLRDEAREALHHAETAIAIADEYGLEMWSALGHIDRGWAMTHEQDGEAAVRELRRGLTAYEATGGRLWRPHFLGLLAEALARLEREDEGLAAIAEALALVDSTGEASSAAELYRLQGDLMILRATRQPSGSRPDVEECFTRAYQVAHDQHARAWEARIAASQHLLP
jgi:DNA-binding winged helix-turn-helix (wHTH) protein/tetratricopeptide (TPR) repeat protein